MAAPMNLTFTLTQTVEGQIADLKNLIKQQATLNQQQASIKMILDAADPLHIAQAIFELQTAGVIQVFDETGTKIPAASEPPISNAEPIVLEPLQPGSGSIII